MLSGDMGARLMLTTCPDGENNRSRGTVVAGEARYLLSNKGMRWRTFPPSFQWTSSFVDLWFSSIMSR